MLETLVLAVEERWHSPSSSFSFNNFSDLSASENSTLKRSFVLERKHVGHLGVGWTSLRWIGVCVFSLFVCYLVAGLVCRLLGWLVGWLMGLFCFGQLGLSCLKHPIFVWRDGMGEGFQLLRSSFWQCPGIPKTIVFMVFTGKTIVFLRINNKNRESIVLGPNWLVLSFAFLLSISFWWMTTSQLTEIFLERPEASNQFQRRYWKSSAWAYHVTFAGCSGQTTLSGLSWQTLYLESAAVVQPGGRELPHTRHRAAGSTGLAHQT